VEYNQRFICVLFNRSEEIVTKSFINITFFIFFLLVLFIWLWHYFSPFDIYNPAVDEFGTLIKNGSSSVQHPLGTDSYGIDRLLKLSEGLSYDLNLSFFTLLAFLLTGISIGVSMGFERKSLSHLQIKQLKRYWTSAALLVLQRIGFLLNNIFQTIPITLVLIVTVLVVQRYVDIPTYRLYIDMIVLGVFSSPKLAISLQHKITLLRKNEFILAAKAMGMSNIRLIFKHILWYECSGIILLNSVNIIIQAVMVEIFLTYFNFGSDQLSIGTLLKQDMNILSMYQFLTTQEMIFALLSFITIMIFSLSFRWFGERLMEINEV